jgi:hypothetical protein
MDWALRFARVRSAFDALIGEKWKNDAARKEISLRLKTYLDAKPDLFKPTVCWRFGDLSQPVAVIDSCYQVNIAKVGSLWDPLDDFYGAVGAGLLKVAISGMVTNGPRSFTIDVDALGVYLRDTYDFNGDQFLGVWSANGIDGNIMNEFVGRDFGTFPEIAIQADKSSPRIPSWRTNPNPEYAVSNASFRRYRDLTGYGGDFVNVSNVKVISLMPAQRIVIEV